MSVNLKMSRFGMSVTVDLTNNDSGYEVNTTGILSKIEDLIGQIEFFDNVNIEIKKSTESVSGDEWPYHDDIILSGAATDTITVTSTGGDEIFTSMADSGYR